MHGARRGAPKGERNGNYRHGVRTKKASELRSSFGGWAVNRCLSYRVEKAHSSARMQANLCVGLMLNFDLVPPLRPPVGATGTRDAPLESLMCHGPLTSSATIMPTSRAEHRSGQTMESGTVASGPGQRRSMPSLYSGDASSHQPADAGKSAGASRHVCGFYTAKSAFSYSSRLGGTFDNSSGARLVASPSTRAMLVQAFAISMKRS
jgi:hypothetical protein